MTTKQNQYRDLLDELFFSKKKSDLITSFYRQALPHFFYKIIHAQRAIHFDPTLSPIKRKKTINLHPEILQIISFDAYSRKALWGEFFYHLKRTPYTFTSYSLPTLLSHFKNEVRYWVDLFESHAQLINALAQSEPQWNYAALATAANPSLVIGQSHFYDILQYRMTTFPSKNLPEVIQLFEEASAHHQAKLIGILSLDLSSEAKNFIFDQTKHRAKTVRVAALHSLLFAKDDRIYLPILEFLNALPFSEGNNPLSVDPTSWTWPARKNDFKALTEYKDHLSILLSIVDPEDVSDFYFNTTENQKALLHGAQFHQNFAVIDQKLNLPDRAKIDWATKFKLKSKEAEEFLHHHFIHPNAFLSIAFFEILDAVQPFLSYEASLQFWQYFKTAKPEFDFSAEPEIILILAAKIHPNAIIVVLSDGFFNFDTPWQVEFMKILSTRRALLKKLYAE